MRNIFIVLIFVATGCNSNDKKTPAETNVTPTNIDGEILFKANCASCHKCDKEFTAPALKGSLERWGGDKKAMYDFIGNPSKAVVENPYAKRLFEKWNKTIMPASNLSAAELDAIMNLCEEPKQ